MSMLLKNPIVLYREWRLNRVDEHIKYARDVAESIFNNYDYNEQREIINELLGSLAGHRTTRTNALLAKIQELNEEIKEIDLSA